MAAFNRGMILIVANGVNMSLCLEYMNVGWRARGGEVPLSLPLEQG